MTTGLFNANIELNKSQNKFFFCSIVIFEGINGQLRAEGFEIQVLGRFQKQVTLYKALR